MDLTDSSTALSLDEPREGVLSPIAVAALVLILMTAVFSLLFPHLWYGEHDVSDIVIYFEKAQTMAGGAVPYRDFDLEYPPLAPAIFALPGHTGDLNEYTRWFSVAMFLFTLATGLVVVATAARIWRDGRHLLLAAVAAAGAVAAVGAIVENRFDIVVALTMALAVLFLVRKQPVAAAVALGFGFALKLTPAALLPIVLILAGTRRRTLAAAGAFAVAAILPFVPYLAMAPGGVLRTFTYHMDRPLQIESVLATPLLVGQALGWTKVQVTTSFGSQGIAAPGATLLAAATTYLTVAAALSILAIVWWRREDLRHHPRLIAVAVYTLVLALLVFGKVLSPQYLLWLVPLVPLAALCDRWLAVTGFGVLFLTQVNFPAKYWGLVYLDRSAILWLAARNALLVIALGVAIWRLCTLERGWLKPRDLRAAGDLERREPLSPDWGPDPGANPARGSLELRPEPAEWRAAGPGATPEDR